MNQTFPSGLYRSVALVAVAAAGVFSSPAIAEISVETQLLVPANQAVSIQIGPNGQVAGVVRQGSRVVMMVNGEAGPRFDRFLAATGSPMRGREIFPGNMNEVRGRDRGDHPVVFSPDGSRYAYVGLDGADYVIVVDGKEVHRAPYAVGVLPANGPTSTILAFSPTGRRFWFVAKSSQPALEYRLYMDGRPDPVPLQSAAAFPAFSADDKHYAYTTHPATDRSRDWRLVVDGKAAAYAGFDPQFLPNGKLLTLASDAGIYQILVDGKSLYKGARPGKIVTSADSRIGAIIDWKAWVDGKFLDGTDGAQRVYFSPNGKRVAVFGGNPGGTGPFWMWVDGVKSDSYTGIQHIGPPNLDGSRTHVAFTADSAKAYAIGFNAGMQFLLINGKEVGDGYQFIAPLTSTQGGRLGFIGTGANRASVCVIDDTVYSSPDWRVGGGTSTPVVDNDSLTFSPDGSRSYFLLNNGPRPTHYLDGKPVDLGDLSATGWNSANTGPSVFAVFSPDGKRVSYVGAERISGGNRYWIFLDGEKIQSHENGIRRSPGFTPDGRHLCWLNAERAEGRPGMDLIAYIDGKRALAMNFQNPWGGHLLQRNEIMHLGADGKVRLLAVTDEGLVRHTISL